MSDPLNLLYHPVKHKHIQNTSLESYHDLPYKQSQQLRVYAYLLLFPDGLTDSEGMRGLSITDPNNYRPRRKDLVDEGKVVDSGQKRTDEKTGKRQIVWKAVYNPRGKEDS